MHASSERSTDEFHSKDNNEQQKQQQQQLPASGSFFHEVPSPKEDGSTNNNSNDDGGAATIEGTITESVTSVSSSLINEFGIDDGDLEMFQQIVRKTRLSTNNGTGGRGGGGGGFAKTTTTSDYTSPSIIRTTRRDTSTGDRESFVGIGMPLNDVNNPEYDKDGYTLYADEVTGEKRRVFEALVEYPSVFKMKIVGSDGDDIQQQQQDNGDHDKIKNDESNNNNNNNNNKLLFAPSIVKVVAESCGVDVSAVQHTIRKNGKWISVTVYAPVQNADMLYSLYENVDKDPRVKFKF